MIESQRSADLWPKARQSFQRSIHIIHVDAGSDNSCESEIKAITNPYYDIHRLGLFMTNSPRHADLLLVTGAVTLNMKAPLLATYEAMPRPRIVVAAGTAACSGGMFAHGTTLGGVDQLLPVEIYVPGSPPSPYAIINGLLKAAGKWQDHLDSKEGSS